MSSQATESTRMIDFLAWVEVNKKKLLIGAAAVGGVIAAYSIYQWHRNEVEAEATAAFYKIQTPASQTERPGGPDAQAFLQVARTHSGTSAGAQALLFGAEGLFRENKFEEAKREFENFLRTYPDHPVASTALLGIATCLDAINKADAALAAYQDVVSRYAGSAVASQAKLGLARVYESKGDLVQTLKIYDELARPPVSSAWGAEASTRREQLVAHHPEFARTNPPAPVLPLALSNPPVTNPPALELKTTNPAAAKTNGPQ
jgi:predicted negative regulator of RcsB-dependent stress response